MVLEDALAVEIAPPLVCSSELQIHTHIHTYKAFLFLKSFHIGPQTIPSQASSK